MKKIRLFSLLGLALVAGTLVGCGSNNSNNDEFIIEDVTINNEVIDYNDTLVDVAANCILSEDDVWYAYNNEGTAEEIQAAIDNTVATCQDTIASLNEIGDREGDSSLKDGIIAVIEQDIAYYTKFAELLPYLDIEDATEEESAQYDAIVDELEAIDSQLEAANESLIGIQSQFAANHGYELDEA